MKILSKFVLPLFSLLLILPAASLSAKADKGTMDTYDVKKVGKHTWAVFGSLDAPTVENKGFMNNPAFTITDKSVIVFDPGSNVYVGRGLLAKIRKLTDKPITHVFNSHIHGDHWLGNQAFLEENPKVKIFAHPQMIVEAKAGEAQVWIDLMENLTNGISSGTEIIYPNNALEDGQEITIDNITVKSHLNEIAHTKTDAMFEIKEDKILITGDNAFRNRSPRLDDGSYKGNIEVMEKALKLDVSTVIPGHGPVGGKEVLTDFKEFLSIVYETSKELLDDDKEAFEMKPIVVEKMEKFKNWNNFDGAIGKLISVAVLEAEEE